MHIFTNKPWSLCLGLYAYQGVQFVVFISQLVSLRYVVHDFPYTPLLGEEHGLGAFLRRQFHVVVHPFTLDSHNVLVKSEGGHDHEFMGAGIHTTFWRGVW